MASLVVFAGQPTHAASAPSSLPPAMVAALKEARIPTDAVSVIVEKLEEPRRGQRPIAHRPNTPMNPASVMKLFTTAAALDLLGPASTWRDELRAERPPVQGVLEGALYFKGSGDPKLNLQQFWLLLRELRLRGLREIHGDLIVDRALFALPPHDAAAFDGEGLRPYNVGADAALVNLNALRLILIPAAQGPSVEVLLETPDADLRLINRVQAVAGDCGDWREKLEFRVEAGSIEVGGRLPRSCGEKRVGVAGRPANAQLEGLFRALWTELGGRWSGKVVEGPLPAETVLLAEIESPPLAEIVRDVNKFSNNVMARQLFLALSAATPPASYEKSAERVREWLQGKGIPAGEWVIDNGSGLSRRDRASAETLSALLRVVWQGPTMPELAASLPAFGEDGTLKKRGNGKGARSGRAHLKTGYLEGARALAGYVLDAQGQRWSLVALINHANARAGRAALDALVEHVLGGANASGAP